MQNEKQVARRLIALRAAADVLKSLQAEMPVHQMRLEAAEKMVRTLADQYEARSAFADEERKPPQRVTPRGRRKPVATKLVYEPGVGVQRREHLEAPMDNRKVDEENEG